MWQQLKAVFRTPRKKFWDMLMNNHEYSGKTSSAKSSSRSIFMRMSQLSRLFKKKILVAALMLREGVRRNWKQIVLMDG